MDPIITKFSPIFLNIKINFHIFIIHFNVNIFIMGKKFNVKIKYLIHLNSNRVYHRHHPLRPPPPPGAKNSNLVSYK